MNKFSIILMTLSFCITSYAHDGIIHAEVGNDKAVDKQHLNEHKIINNVKLVKRQYLQNQQKLNITKQKKPKVYQNIIID